MKKSYYYKYNFVSPEIIYTEIKEELKSYFQTGVIDDILFPRYTEDCLKRLGKGSYKIEENILCLDDYQTQLPENFESVRELWLVTPYDMHYRMPTHHYEQTTTKISSDRDGCHNTYSAPNEIKVTYKTTGTVIQKFSCHHLLKPGNINVNDKLSDDNWNKFSDSNETFDIRGNKLITNFPSGTLYMVYYVKEYDCNEYQLVPDNIRIKDYLKAYIKYKCFENIYNNVSDETIKQVEAKLGYYEGKMNEARVLAETEIKKQTVEQQFRSIKSSRRMNTNRFNIT